MQIKVIKRRVWIKQASIRANKRQQKELIFKVIKALSEDDITVAIEPAIYVSRHLNIEAAIRRIRALKLNNLYPTLLKECQ